MTLFCKLVRMMRMSFDLSCEKSPERFRQLSWQRSDHLFG